MLKEMTLEEKMKIEGGDTVKWDSKSGGGLGYSWIRDSKGISITVTTIFGTAYIRDDFSNDLNENKRDNSRGIYR